MMFLRIYADAVKLRFSHNIIAKTIMGVLHFFGIHRRQMGDRNIFHSADLRHLFQFYGASIIVCLEPVIQDHKNRSCYIPHRHILDHDIRDAAAFRAFDLDAFPPDSVHSAVTDNYVVDIPDGFQADPDPRT